MCFSAEAPFTWRKVMPDSAATLLNCTRPASRGPGLAACSLSRGTGADSSNKFAPKIRKALRRSIAVVGPIIPVVVSGSALPAGNQGFHIVSQLPGGELIAFEIGCQPALAIDYQGMQRVR